jgi:hypothetical protein
MTDYLLCGKMLFINNFNIMENYKNNKLEVSYSYLLGSFCDYKEYFDKDKKAENILFNLPNHTEEIIIAKIFLCGLSSIKIFNDYFSNLPCSVEKITIYSFEICYYKIENLLNREDIKRLTKKEIKNLLFKKLPFDCKVKINYIHIF